MITSFNRRFFLLCFSVCSFLILLRGEQCKEPRIIQFHRSDDKKRSSNLITFLQNNDIYDLDYLPRQATAFQQYKNTEVPTIYILNGDFLSPMKKTFDDGEAMVESLNRVWNGPSIFLVGNHEFDISSKEFIKRMNESNHPWILSNVNHIQTPDNKCLEEYIIIEVNDIPILAVIGLMTNDKKEFDPNIFQRVEIQDPFITAERLTKKIHDSYPGLPVIAQTHLSWEDDEKLASTGLFVAIFGGHDHHLETRRTNNSTIVKCYEDARYYCKVEVWYNLTQETTLISEITDITVTSYDNEDYSPDPSLSAFIQQIYKEIEPQNESCLFAIPEGSTLTTHKLRRQEGSMAKFLLSRFVDIFHADAALMSSGNIRGDRDYTDCGSILSLHALFPFSASKPIAINIPGYIIEEMITYSRRSAFLDPPRDNADFLQVDSRLEYDMKEKKVRSIASRSFQPDRTYRVVVNCLILGGSNGHQPLLDYYAKNEISTNSQCSDDLPSMFEILYHHFLNKGFSTLFQDHSFQQLDKDRSGAITIEELKEAFKVVNHFTLHDDLLQRMWEMVSLPMHDSLEEERKVTYDQYKKIMKNLLNVTIESLSSSSLPSSSAPQPPLLDLDESFWKSSATPEILRFSSL